MMTCLHRYLSFSFLGLLFAVFLTWVPLSALANGDFEIRGVVFHEHENVLEVQTEGLPGNLSESDYRGVKLADPLSQYVISFPRAKLAPSLPKDQAIYIRQKGVESVLFSQPSAYTGVLMRVSASSPAVLSQIKVLPSSTGFTVSLGQAVEAHLPQASEPTMRPPITGPPPVLPVRTPSMPPPSIAPQAFVPFVQNAGLNQIRAATAQNGSVTVVARPGDVLVIKNRMVMNNPTRLVLDLERTQLEGTGTKPPVTTGDPLMPQIRFGQFEPDTVRMVVETPSPDSIMVIYPTQGRDRLLISPSQGTQPFETLPIADQQVGTIQDIWLEKQEGNRAVVKIVSSVPIVRTVTRQGNTIVAQFPNLIGRDAPVYFDKQSFPFIKSMHVSPLQAMTPNVKLSIVLERENALMTQFLSRDGKYLEIKLELPSQTVTAVDGPLPRAPGKKLIVVDAGHGGKDSGATRAGIYEKDITLATALKLTKTLEAMGYQVVMTRNVDKFLELSEISGITNKVMPDVFVSVHVNSCPNAAITGLETYFYHPQSRALADAVHKQLVNRLKVPDRSVRSAKFYVINHTEVPAILCEIGYITNPQERTELTTAARQQATADSIARGVTDFLKMKVVK